MEAEGDIENDNQKADEIGLPMLPINYPADSLDDKKISTDIIERNIGGMGKYQMFICAIIFITKFSIAFHQMAIIFLAPPFSYTCKDTDEVLKCPCEEPIYDRTIFKETIIMSFDLICGQRWLADMSQTIFMLGILIGSVGFGTLSDMYGRRLPLIWSVILQLVGGIAAIFAPNFWTFTFFRFIVGAATGGMMVSGYVLCLEFVGKDYRELLSALYQLPFNVGHLIMAGLGYSIRTWTHFQLAITLPSIILLSYYWILPESPRWLLSTGNSEKAISVLEKAARVNKMPTEHIAQDVDFYQKSKSKAQLQKGKFSDLFRTPKIRRYTLCMSFNWLVCGYGFYGISQYIGRLAGNIFINVAVSAFITIPGTLISIPLMKRVGRKLTVIGPFIITSLCLFAIAVIPEDYSLVKVLLACMGNVCIFISFLIVYLYASEVFPTVVRNAGIGITSMSARIGSMIAPYVAGLTSVASFLPPLLFGIMPLIAAVLCMFLPETKDCELTNTIEEAENFESVKKRDK